MLRKSIADDIEHAFVLHGRLSKKQRGGILTELFELEDSAPRVLLATGRLFGEGFDHPPLDTLVLAMPISWKGTLQQYAGRLHREHVDKQISRTCASMIMSNRTSLSLPQCGTNAGVVTLQWGIRSGRVNGEECQAEAELENGLTWVRPRRIELDFCYRGW